MEDRQTVLARLYLIGGVMVLALYVGIEALGLEFGLPTRQTIPADVRRSPGGYRSFHFWHSGYAGGK